MSSLDGGQKMYTNAAKSEPTSGTKPNAPAIDCSAALFQSKLMQSVSSRGAGQDTCFRHQAPTASLQVQRIGISNPISPPPTASYAREQLSQQQKTAQEQIKQQQQAAQALLISNQVSKGFELLAGPEIEKRLGGIYALEAVMNNSEQPQYHQPLLEALCAFVREKAHRDGTTTDVQAALTVIGRRAAGPGTIDLTGVSISR